MPEVSITLKAQDEASSTLEKVTQKTNDLDGGLGKIAGSFNLTTVASTAFGFSLAGLAEKSVSWAKDFIEGTIQAGAQMQILQTKAEVLFGTSFPEMNRTMDEMARTLHRDNSEIQDFVTSADMFTQSMGMGEAQARSMSLGMADLAVKIGQATGKSEPEAFAALERGLKGMGRALVDVGIDLDKNVLQQFMVAQGIKGHYEALDDASKATVAYQYLLTQQGKIEEMAAKNQEGYTEKTTQLSAAWNGLEESLGKLTVEPATEGINSLIGFVDGLTSKVNMATQAWTFLSGAISGGSVQSGFSALLPKTEGQQAAEDYWNRAATGNMRLGGISDTQASQAMAGNDWKKTLKEMPDLTGKAAKGHEELMNKLDALNQRYEQDSNDIAARLTMLDEAHQSKVQSIQDSIKGLQDSLKDLKDTYADTVDGMNRKGEDLLGNQDKLIKNLQQKLDDLQRRASQENRKGSTSLQTSIDIERTQKELDQAQAERPKIISTIGLTQAQIAQENVRESKGSNLVAAEDLVAERAKKEKDFANKTGDINEKLVKKNAELGRENENYKDQHNLLINTQGALDAFHEKLVFAMEHADAVTKKSVESMNGQIQALMANLGKISGVLGKQPVNYPTPTAAAASAAAAPAGPSAWDPTSGIPYGTYLSDQLGGAGSGYVNPNYTGGASGQQQLVTHNIQISVDTMNVHSPQAANQLAQELARRIQLQALGAN